MFIATYEAIFHAWSHYATQLVRTKEEKTRLYVKGLNTDLQVLLVHMNSTARHFNELTYYVKKIEGVR